EPGSATVGRPAQGIRSGAAVLGLLHWARESPTRRSMNIAKPPIDPGVPEQAAGDVDGLLCEFFRAALPKPWPPFQQPARQVLSFAAAPSWRRRLRSSLALAASLAILAVSLGVLSGKFADRGSPSPGGRSPVGTHQTPDKDNLHHGTTRPEK